MLPQSDELPSRSVAVASFLSGLHREEAAQSPTMSAQIGTASNITSTESSSLERSLRDNSGDALTGIHQAPVQSVSEPSAVPAPLSKGQRKANANSTAKERSYSPGNRPFTLISGGSNFTAEADCEPLLGWDQLHEGSAPASGTGAARVRRGSSSNTGSASSTSTRGAGRFSLSSVCARQWGQDGVAAELSGSAGITDQDLDRVDGAESDILLMDKRPFVGSTARAVKLSRANKSYARLQNARKAVPPPADQEEAEHAPLGNIDTAYNTSTPACYGSPPMLPARTMSNICGSRENCLFSAVLKPLERLLVSVIVSPSPEYVDGATGVRIGEQLVDRTIPLVAAWRLVEESSTVADFRSHPIALSFKSCLSRIGVSPESLYELGMCNVGEQRTLVLEVTNLSELPALVYPVVRSEVLELAEQQDEVRIPPLSTRQVRVHYLPRVEQGEYWDRVALLNAYNEGDNKVVAVKARNVDTEQVLLHSLFYKLVTYNSMRQLQVAFERGLINMPNLRVFSMKNIHNKPLGLRFSWSKKARMRLFLVVNQQQAKELDGVALEDVDAPDGTVFDAPSKATGKAVAQGGSTRAQQQDDIEDMKWGDNTHGFSGSSVSGSLAAGSKAISKLKRSMSMYSKGTTGVHGVSGDDGAVNYGKGSVYEPKPSQINSSADILSVLDLSQSCGGGTEPAGEDMATAVARSVDGGSREGRFQDSAQGAPQLPGSENAQSTGRANRTAQRKVELLAPSQPQPVLASAPCEVKADLLEQFDKESFPYSFVEDVAVASGMDAEESGVSFKKSKLPATGSQETNGLEEKKVTGRSGRSTVEEGGRPHSISTSVALSYAVGNSGDTPSAQGGGRDRAKPEIEQRVKRLQKAYADLRQMIDGAKSPGTSCLQELPVEDNNADSAEHFCASVEIPVGTTFRFAIVFEPQQRAEFEDVDEYTQVRVSEILHIHLPDVGAVEVAAALERHTQRNGPDDAHVYDEHPDVPAEGLRPRSLPVRASLVRSEMVVIQKNINFGRTVLNDKSSRVVTVVNRSSIPCIYSISKSGSISSGFLQVPSGRKGIIAPFSSKAIEFIFKPTMAGSFEEVLMIHNVLNPRDAQTVTIKAKVHHTETFVISPAPAVSAASEEHDRAAPLSTAGEAKALSALEAHLGESSSAPFPSHVKSVVSFLGCVLMGGDVPGAASGTVMVNTISFKIKNVTNKPRQFIVDATHAHAIELFAGACLPSESEGAIEQSQEKLGIALPFEPVTAILQSVLCLRCRFDSEVVKGGGASAGRGEGGAGDGSLSNEERKALEDSLEAFQQKLKIAIRKNKAEKIEKYQKKIDKVILALQDNQTHAVIPAAAAEGLVEKEEARDMVGAETPAEQLATLQQEQPQPALSGESEVSFHFLLEPEQERLVHVKLSFLPGPAYRSWSGSLPFHGFLRIFECKNEDHVKVVHFGAMVRTGRLSVASAIPFAGEPTSLDGAAGYAVRQHERSDSIVDYSRVDQALGVTFPFVSTVAQWSSLPTREVYPKYRQLPQNLLPMCVKLVRASKDRVMHGSFSVASLLERAGALSLTIDEDFSAKIFPDFATYNPSRHGPVLFALARAATSPCKPSDQQQPEDLVLGEKSSLAAEIGSKPRSKKDKVIHREQKLLLSNSKLQAGSKVDFSVQWRPPLDLSFSKQHPAPSSASADVVSSVGRNESSAQHASLRIVGAIKVQLCVDNQPVGLSQSIPFVGVLEHKSSFSVPKYFAFEGVSVGSYCTYQVPITNTSAECELHYVVSSEDVAASSKVLGSVEFISGYAGTIQPGGCNQLALLFSASSPGKFEQKLWIRNINDSFDQKRLVVQAAIAVPQTKFVSFPDLEVSGDGGVGKYKTIDLGLIQIQSPTPDPQLEALVPSPAEQRCFYELRIENVSRKPLTVTAVSNLKSQCYIYSDENCSQLAVYTPLPVSAMTTLFVKIKPSPGGSSAADAGAGPGAEQADVSEGDTLEDRHRRADVPAGQSSANGGGRELMGGIKLVFFSAETSTSGTAHVGGDGEEKTGVELSASAQPSAAVSSVPPRKLFETALSFKAVVGKSALKASTSQQLSLHCVETSSAAQRSAASDYFCGKFELKNSSKVFPLDYSYILRPEDECTGGAGDLDGPSGGDGSELTKSELRLRIADQRLGHLAPGETKQVLYTVLHSTRASGLVLCPLRLVNINTMETTALTLTTFLDPGHIVCAVREQYSADREDCSAQGPASLEDCSGGRSRSERQLLPVPCAGVLWAYHHTARVIEKIAEYSQSAGELDPDSSDFVPPSAKDSSSGASWPDGNLFTVQGASVAELCSWTITNTKDKSITLFPISDLPVHVEVSPLECAEHSTEQSSLPVTSSSRQSSTPSAGLSPALLRWKHNLIRCGAPVTLEAAQSAIVTVSARRGASFKEKAAKLTAGKLAHLNGVVVLLQGAHSLQSLFDPVPGKDFGGSTDKSLLSTDSVTPTEVKPKDLYLAPFEVLPVVSVVQLRCPVAAPELHLPVREISLGRLRYGADSFFEFVVENPSEVDVPACLDGLPAWLSVEKLLVAPIGGGPPAGMQSSAVGRSDEELMAYSDSVCLEWADPSSLAAMRAEGDTRTGTGKSAASSLGAQKLHWWIATNGATISDLSQQTLGATPARRRGSKESNLSFEDWQRVLSETASATSLLQRTEDEETAADTSRENLGSLEPAHDADLQLSSLEVQHEQFLHHYQNELSLEVSDSDLFHLHNSLVRGVSRSRNADDSLNRSKLFGIPARSRVLLCMHTKVPVVQSQSMQHTIKVRNLSTAIIPSSEPASYARHTPTTGSADAYLLDQAGAVVVADELRLHVSLQVDATRALELIAAIDEPLTARLPNDALAAKNTQPGAAPCYRLLKDPFIVPPPVEVTLQDDPSVSNLCGDIQPVAVTAKVSKTHCRFSIKNKLAENVRVHASIQMNPALQELLGMKAKFQTTNSQVIELVPEESTAVKVRVVPKLSARLTSATIGPLLRSSYVPSDPKSGGVFSFIAVPAIEERELAIIPEASSLMDVSVVAAGTALPAPLPSEVARSTAMGATATPVLIGTICITPFRSAQSEHPDSAGSHTQGGAALLASELDGVLQSDIIELDIVGFINPGSTLAASVDPPTHAPAALQGNENATSAPSEAFQQGSVSSALEFRAAAADLHHSSSSDSTFNDIAPKPFSLAKSMSAEPLSSTAVSAAPFSLSLPAPDELSAILRLKETVVSFYVTNPSSSSRLNFEIRSQTYRHAGMRLLLDVVSSDCGVGNSPQLEAFDTFWLEPSPSKGTLAPSSMCRVTLRLAPGDPRQAIKASTTLNGEIPDLQMRERRLRSHHRDKPNALNGTSSGRLGTRSSTGIAGMAIEGISRELPSSAATEPVVSGPAASSAGPYTIACMPIEIWDTDFTAHPPRVLHAYLTSEVALSVISTQSLRESCTARNSNSFFSKRALTAAPSSEDTPMRPTDPASDTAAWVAGESATSPKASSLNNHALAWSAGDDLAISLGDGYHPESELRVLDVGLQTQRKETLEVMVTLENASTAPVQYSLLPVFRGNLDRWLELSQSGGWVPPHGKTSFAVYLRRTIPLGAYTSYVLVRNCLDQADCRVLKVLMQVAPEGKRTLGSHSLGTALRTSGRTEDDGSSAPSRSNASSRNLSVDPIDVSALSLPSLLVDPERLRTRGAAVTTADPGSGSIGAEREEVAGRGEGPVQSRTIFDVWGSDVDGNYISPIRILRGATEDEADGHGRSVGLSLSPQPSPTTTTCKRAAHEKQEKTLYFTVQSAADIALELEVRMSSAIQQQLPKFTVKLRGSATAQCGPDQPVLLDPHQRQVYAVTAIDTEDGANLQILFDYNSAALEGDRSGTQRRLLGSIALNCLHFPDQTQCLYVFRKQL